LQGTLDMLILRTLIFGPVSRIIEAHVMKSDADMGQRVL
jgi:hypothetical protein